MINSCHLLSVSITELEIGRTTALEITEEKSSSIFLKFGTENCLKHLMVFISISAFQQLILKEGSCSIHFISLCRQAAKKNSLNVTLMPAELTYSETITEILPGDK